MDDFRNNWFVYLLVAVIAVTVVVLREEKKSDPVPAAEREDLPRMIPATKQTLPQRLKKSPHEMRRLVCRASEGVPGDAYAVAACHNYPSLASVVGMPRFA